jgi:hypothetical protein
MVKISSSMTTRYEKGKKPLAEFRHISIHPSEIESEEPSSERESTRKKRGDTGLSS